VRVGASPETEARRAAITLVTLAVGPSGRERTGILAGVSDLTEIRDAARTFIAEREWQQFQDPKSILLALVGEVGELAELLQWLPADVARDRIREEPLHSRASEEMADVLIYLVGLADQCGVNLGSAALAKIEASADKYPTDQTRGIAPDKS
jgi:dCTP diphosphatase